MATKERPVQIQVPVSNNLSDAVGIEAKPLGLRGVPAEREARVRESLNKISSGELFYPNAMIDSSALVFYGPTWEMARAAANWSYIKSAIRSRLLFRREKDLDLDLEQGALHMQALLEMEDVKKIHERSCMIAMREVSRIVGSDMFHMMASDIAKSATFEASLVASKGMGLGDFERFEKHSAQRLSFILDKGMGLYGYVDGKPYLYTTYDNLPLVKYGIELKSKREVRKFLRKEGIKSVNEGTSIALCSAIFGIACASIVNLCMDTNPSIASAAAVLSNATYIPLFFAAVKIARGVKLVTYADMKDMGVENQ
jgi:hypothetical protein